MDYKAAIIDALDTLRKRDLSEKQPFKARAYATVISQLKQMDGPVTCYEDVSTLKGVGEQIQKKIKEIIETGHLRTADKAKEVYHIGALDQLQQVYGIGPAKAKALVEAGIRSVTDLRRAAKKDPSLLHEKQTIGLKYYEELLERIPREEMLVHQDILKHYLKDAELVGSFRRGSTGGEDPASQMGAAVDRCGIHPRGPGVGRTQMHGNLPCGGIGCGATLRSADDA